MGDNEETSIIPPILNPGDAKAIEETAKAWGITVDAATKLGGFFFRALGTIPQDALGLIIGDWLHQTRIRTLAWHAQKTEEKLRKRGILGKTEPISPSIAIPLLQAAQDETRDELKEIWNRLITNAMDPERSSAVRRNIIETVKQFEPLDALVLETLVTKGTYGALSHRFSDNELEVSARYLFKTECLDRNDKSTPVFPGKGKLFPSGFGREVIRACSL